MALDAAMIGLLARHLDQELTGARIERINMPARDEVVFQLRTPAGHRKLLVCARSGCARVHLTGEEFENPPTPPSFCMLLRKYLGTGRITGVHAADGERILFVAFECVDSLGDLAPVTLSVEMMGRYCNIVLVNGAGRVIDALKRIDFEQSELRQLLPGLPFTMPPAQQKIPFLGADADSIAQAVCSLAKPLSQALLDKVSGIGPVVCREIAARTDRMDSEADTLVPSLRLRLRDTIAYVQRCARGEDTGFHAVYEGEKPVEFSFIDLTQYEGFHRREYADPSCLLDGYFARRDREERVRARSAGLRKQVDNLIERAERRNAARTLEIDNSEKAQEKRLYGELLNAGLHAVEKGASSVQLLNYYTGLAVRIPLDPARTPVQNAQRYFRDYRKLTTAAKVLATLIEEGERELEWLKTVRYEIECAVTEEDFTDIRSELQAEGYLRTKRVPDAKRRKKRADVASYRTSGGFRVLSGRNNAANDRLTMRMAGKNDWWFHVKSAPGSHTVLLCDNAVPSDQDLTEAATIAACNSSLAAGNRAEVDYTQVRNVHKPPGSKPGMVIYERYMTAVVKPDRTMADRLIDGKRI